MLKRISAMVVDIRPAAGTAVSLQDFFGAYLVRNHHSAFLVQSRFESVDETKFDIFSIVFPVNRRHMYRYFGLRQ